MATAPSGLVEPDVEDLTARARIRDAALRLFADRGVEATTIREIAREAGVSGGLIRHHFGSKDDLRSACDTYALERLMKIKEQAVSGGQVINVGFYAAVQPTLLLTYRYFARSLIDGSSAAASLFDEMVQLTEQWLHDQYPTEMPDPRAYAVVLVGMEIGLLAMHDQVSRALGQDMFSPAGHLRLLGARIEFYSQPLLSPELADQSRRMIDALQTRERIADASSQEPAQKAARRRPKR